ncbi:MAG: TrkH family potassium uptake protein [Gammaproteobacteria bacterium]|nr:TrkH family potassium uptake protein [Gammaproteobacteria bacterium]MBU1732999.1 TrkH family potassium uptake protein [Gammaproteobacteria bacterium]MBU1892047.1 TrkH family potassium uptake protein [Gammaproteobacteria bacterium]
MNRLFPIAHVLGMVTMLFSLTMLAPLILSWWFQDGAMAAYDEAIVTTFLAGLLTWWSTRRAKRELKIRDGFLLVVLIWSSLAAFATIPLMVYLPELSFTDAYFETISGLTTSGASVLSGLDSLPPSINFWRTELVWLGGMGLIVLAVAVLPLLGIGGRQLYKAETPGPMKDSQLTPRITETAKGLWLVYAGITVACMLSFRWAGMDWFDAVIHAFSTMGLGGFSSHDASFGYFDSPLIESVTIVFMLIAGINFASHFMVWRSKSFAPYRHDPEARLFLGVILASVVGLAVYLQLMGVYPDFLTALRFAAFNTVSIATTTGFANTDYNLWPIFAPLWMLFLCSFASSSGSTGGGIKMIRAQILYKQVYREMKKLLHPNGVMPTKLGGMVVPNKIIYAVLAFLFIYVASIVSLTLVMTASGLDVITAFSAIVAMINNTGPGLNQVGPATNYAVLTDFQTWVCTFTMLLGRLELFTLLILFTPAFWRK